MQREHSLMVERTTDPQDAGSRRTARLEALEACVESTREQAAQDPQTHLDALMSLGQSYLDAGDAPRALTQFEEGLALTQQHGYTVAEARLWGFKGMALIRLGNAQFAQRSLFRALNLARETKQTALVIDTLMHIGELHASTGQQTKAIARFEQAFGLALQAGELARYLLAAGKLGDLFLAMNAPDKALEYYASALQTAEAMGNHRAMSAFQTSLGNGLLVQGEQAAAGEQFEAALELADAEEDGVAGLRALNGLLRTQIAARKITLALLYGERVVQLAQEMGDEQTEIANLNLLVTFLLQQGQIRKAIPFLERGLVIARTQEDWSWQLSMLTNLGFAHHQNEALALALDAYRQALHWADQLQDRPAVAQLEGRIGAVLADMGEARPAIAAVGRALDLAQALDNQALIGEQQILLAFLYHDLGNRDQALDFCRQAVTTFEATGDGAFAANAQTLLAELSQMTA